MLNQINNETKNPELSLSNELSGGLINLFGGEQEFSELFREVWKVGFHDTKNDLLIDHKPLVNFYFEHSDEISELATHISKRRGAGSLADFVWHDADMNDEWTKDDVLDALYKQPEPYTESLSLLPSILWSWQVKLLGAYLFLDKTALTT